MTADANNNELNNNNKYEKLKGSDAIIKRSSYRSSFVK